MGAHPARDRGSHRRGIRHLEPRDVRLGIIAIARTPAVALGDALGSNVSNGLMIVGTASSIYPIIVSVGNVALGLATGLVLTLLVFPPASGWLGRGRGALLLAVYGGHVFFTLRLGLAH